MLRSAIDAVNAGGLVRRALDASDIVRPLSVPPRRRHRGGQSGRADDQRRSPRRRRVRCAHCSASVHGVQPIRGPLPSSTHWYDAGHPLPDDGSVAGARRALEVAARRARRSAARAAVGRWLGVDGAAGERTYRSRTSSSTARMLMEQGADIYELNTVRKHLSAIKGGQLAWPRAGTVLTLAVSDVVGDDLSVIASGPTVADDSTFAGGTRRARSARRAAQSIRRRWSVSG